MSAGEDCPTVVSAEWLAEALKKPTNKIRVLDVTWTSEQDERQSYLASHIEGAGYFNMMQGVVADPLFPRAYPSSEHFTEQARSLGIDTDTHVVVYDRSEGKCGFFIGGRVWLMFQVYGHKRVSVLNGGMTKWTGPVDSVLPTFNEGNFQAAEVSDLIMKYEEVQQGLGSDSFQIVDTRPPSGYSGNPADLKTGHVPGAKNVPFAQFLDAEAGLMKTEEQLRKLLVESGVDLNKTTVGMCNSGMSSSTLLLILERLGVKIPHHLYLGGFTEWKSRSPPEQIERS